MNEESEVNSRIRPIAENVFGVSHKLRLFGLPVLTRMCVIRLSEGDFKGKLWVWSPVQIDEAMKAELDRLGEVSIVVAPNTFHHMYIGTFKKYYPHAVYMAPKELQNRKKKFRFDRILTNDALPEPWPDEIGFRVMRGSAFYSEAIFFHKPSRTLIVTDLLIQGKRSHWSVDWFWRLYGVLDGPGTTPVGKLLTRDRVAARAVIEEVLRWDFDRVVMAHGKPIESGGRAAFREALSWLL